MAPRAPRRLKQPMQEARIFRTRALIGVGGVLLALLALAAWYFRLQVLQHSDYAERARANQIKSRLVASGRGRIFDRRGRVLADNIPAYRLDITPSDAGDVDRVVADLAGIIHLSAEDIAAFQERRRGARPFNPVPIKLRLSDEEMARLAVDRWRFPGVDVVPYLSRVYPYGDLFAHVVGYVGRIDKKDLEGLGEDGQAYSHIGKTGLERYYEVALRGRPGAERVERTVDGRPIRTLDTIPAKPGSDLRLTIDADLQQAMVSAFGELQGSAVAIDPRTGGILAMVSLPAFDPNLFINGISRTDYQALIDDPGRPQFNRVVLGGVAPGSTIKPFLALIGLEAGVRTPEDRILSTGMFYIGGQRRGYGDSHRGGHGWTDLRKSIYESVNTYYYKLALDLGIERFDQWMDRFGFGHPTGVDLSGEIAGILPSPAWKAKYAPKQGRWYPGDTAISGIGQGFWKATPLQLAQATAALADDGRMHRPHLVESARNGVFSPWVPMPQPPPRILSTNPAHLRAVREGMIGTVHGPGTATNIRHGLSYHIASKTGTAQVVSRRGTAAMDPRRLPMHLRHRALFIAYAPAEAPTIAVAVAVEGGGYGASTAAPIARQILDAWIVGRLPDGLKPFPVPGEVAVATTVVQTTVPTP